MLRDVRRDTQCHKIGNHLDYLFYRKGSGDTVEIYDIAVKSDRRRGKGTEMFNKLIDITKAERVFAITRRSNHGAQKFYQNLSMEGVILPGLYPDEDAIMYIWQSK